MNAILRPSGDHAGWKLFAAPWVRPICPLPSAFMIWISELLSRSLANAIFESRNLALTSGGVTLPVAAWLADAEASSDIVRTALTAGGYGLLMEISIVPRRKFAIHVRCSPPMPSALRRSDCLESNAASTNSPRFLPMGSMSEANSSMVGSRQSE